MNALRSLSFALPLAVFLAACGTQHAAGSNGATTGGTGASAGDGTSSSAATGTGGSSASAGGAAGSGGTGAAGTSTGSGGATATTTAATTGASSSSGAAGPPCPCFDGNGVYCQTSAAAYAASHQCSIGTGDGMDLLSCANASWTVDTSCANGCTVEPAGHADQCTAVCNGLSLSDFIAKFTGMCTGYPGWSPSNQCTDLALQWVANLCLPVQFSGNAVDWAGEQVQGFTWVENAPGIVPSPGDVVVFGPVGMTCNDGVTSVGHVDVCVSASAQSNDWSGFDQNWETDWNGTCYPPQIVNHNWSECVIGWQHLTVPVPQ